MNIYTAIMKAAAHIEQCPTEFRWMSTVVPDGIHCGTPGCAVGWIGVFTGARKGSIGFRDVDQALGVGTSSTFYERMGQLSTEREGNYQAWKYDAEICARTLRAYADKYHEPEKPPQRTDAELVSYWTARVHQQALDDAAKSEELTW